MTDATSESDLNSNTPVDLDRQDFRDPDALRRRSGVSGDPNFDQHFLIDDRVLNRIPTYLSNNTDTKHVLEIGAGTGALTDRLLSVGDVVTVVERDPTLASFLHEEFADMVDEDRLNIIEGDALDVTIPPFTTSISNLPYGISSEILFKLLPSDCPLIVMVQREFGERMAADPGTDAYGRLSVSAQHYATVEVVETVPPTAFEPKPAVESAVIRTEPRDPDYTVADETFFLRFVKAVFTQRRKTVRNAIRNTAHISMLDAPEAVVSAADETLLSQRAGDLTPSEFAELATIAAEQGK